MDYLMPGDVLLSWKQPEHALWPPQSPSEPLWPLEAPEVRREAIPLRRRAL
jgi:hypothetical protein